MGPSFLAFFRYPALSCLFDSVCQIHLFLLASMGSYCKTAAHEKNVQFMRKMFP